MDKTDKIKEFLKKLGVEFESVEKKDSHLNDTPRYVIITPEAALLIGNKGETLLSLSHLLKKILSGDEEKEGRENYFIDIGDYQNNRIKDIKNKAVILGERARFFKKDVEMNPMTSYERMIVHSTFADFSDLKTESVGFGPSRRVIIRFQEFPD
ncbi:hypothetical protein COV42_02005 [Candidatus Campbellbacteria bacterium CG11_big_fil_rev_8_21_14_0_20_44_21]|uniref:R3H domain-containing protein n=1 Tax=Candidatus Campbellbacteria bacterium CG22_combo_CG10-13_8_21_14_all_43_18 TaxID=1974530 RepID=A0A2H0DVZ5_9BACT|nr:MAG: hypothetical protein COW82_02540 [Candidatus Campbellbacteria bacterium CG22_combo_CG10-13_8_21_14_all_43_18]PIR24201.1 MAG: hypothetical protein COV42_02005 [Candidatus Campbellbacteria bacterium CG11_big_fil_rev_8_21_14_0_20_44_21]